MQIEIKCDKEQKKMLTKILGKVGENIVWKVIELGSISDEEIDDFGNFTDNQKKIIKEQYSKYPKGFFPNPVCALY